jgi:hypothetical protein
MDDFLIWMGLYSCSILAGICIYIFINYIDKCLFPYGGNGQIEGISIYDGDTYCLTYYKEWKQQHGKN